jgi:nitric oxide reductase NorE protein
MTNRRLPGVDGIWVVIGLDAVVFLLLFASFQNERRAAPALFEVSRRTLNKDLGGADTLILLTSSWLVALAIQAVRRDRTDRLRQLLFAAACTGTLFVASKTVEYIEKLASGTTPATNAFYSWYFLLTGVHLVHVLAGICALGYVWKRARIGSYTSERYLVLECVALFWHLVDLLWIVLFPLLYLQR